MISVVNYDKLKDILLKNFKNMTVTVKTYGAVQTDTMINNANITFCKNKIIISNEDRDVSINFLTLRKINFDDEYRITLKYDDFNLLIEL